MKTKTKTFKGGVHPPDEKALTEHLPIEPLSAPPVVTIPLLQHIGGASELAVAKGDYVRRGTVIGRPSGFISTTQHASVSGVVKEIAAVLTPLGRPAPAVVIENDDRDEEEPLLPILFRDADPKEIRQRVLEAGIVGMGGAGFPAHVKLSPPENKPIDVVLLNGVECEPYLTCDHRLMLEEPEKILDGLDLIARAVGAKTKIIGIEMNTPDAIEVMRGHAVGRDVTIIPLEVKYPQGAEKQLIDAVLGREVPMGGLPMDVGVVVQNVSTAAAISEAVLEGRPLTERIVTVTGRAVAQPRNLRVRLGTPLERAIAACGGFKKHPRKVISGGPMMGLAVDRLTLPVTKGSSGILCLLPEEAKVYSCRQCIRCGRCVDICPVYLVPAEISQCVERHNFAGADDLKVKSCIECGACAYLCPSRRPLTQWFKWAKAEIAADEKRKREEKKNA